MLADSQTQANLKDIQTLPRDHNQSSNHSLNVETQQYRLNRPFYFCSEYLRYLFADVYFTGTLEKCFTYIFTDERKNCWCVTPVDFLPSVQQDRGSRLLFDKYKN